jgi:hypothetical protein
VQHKKENFRSWKSTPFVLFCCSFLEIMEHPKHIALTQANPSITTMSKPKEEKRKQVSHILALY